MIRSTDETAMVLLRSAHRMVCGKRFQRTASGNVVKHDYDHETEWDAYVERVDSFKAITSVLSIAAQRSDFIVVHGRLANEHRRKRIPRLSADVHGEAGTLAPAAKAWLAIDVDKVHATGKTPGERLEDVWRNALPTALRGVSCWWQWTGSYGVDGDENLASLRFFFLLDEAVETTVLRQWAKANTDVLDPSIYVTTQPIYIAAPIFTGMDDPLEGPRFGTLKGEYERVCVEDMHLDDAIAAAERHNSTASVVERANVEPCEAQIESRIAAILEQATDASRHMHALGVVCELYALGTDIPRIHEVATEVMTCQGRPPRAGEVLGLIQHAARKDKEGKLHSRTTPVSELLGADSDEDAEAGDTAEELAEEAGDLSVCSANPDALNAINYLKLKHPEGGFFHWNGSDWEWNGKKWVEIQDAIVLKGRVDRVGGPALSNKAAKACVEKIRGLTSKEHLKAGGWLTADIDEGSFAVAFNNGMVFIHDAMVEPDAALQPHNMDWFNTICLPYNYDHTATCPTWEQCVKDWFLDDVETRREFQKMMGYLLVPDNRFEKYFLLMDPRGRAGKGTAMTVLRWLIGRDAIGSTTLRKLATPYPLDNLIGKRVALIDEASSETKFETPLQTVDIIKSITGNDYTNVAQKYKTSYDQQLPLRFVLSSNRVPTMRDPSGALMTRLHIIEFKQTFAGKENINLKQEGGPLHKELPGIFNWALRGLMMLYFEDKKFKRAHATKDVYESIIRKSAPLRAFVQDCIEPAVTMDSEYVGKDEVYHAYCAWCGEEHLRPWAKSNFWQEMRALLPQHHPAKKDGKRVLWGVRLSEEGNVYLKAGGALLS